MDGPARRFAKVVDQRGDRAWLTVPQHSHLVVEELVEIGRDGNRAQRKGLSIAIGNIV